MATSISGTEKRGRGRPRVDTLSLHVRLEMPQLAALDAWLADLGEPAPSRPEAVRRALADHLRAKGYLPAASEQP